MQAKPIYIKATTLAAAFTQRNGETFVTGTDIKVPSGNASCAIVCRKDCLPKVVRVVFADPENACDPCNRSAGIVLNLDRGQLERVETGLELITTLEFSYPFTDGVTATAADVAAWVIAQVNTPQPSGHDHFGITAGADPDNTTTGVLFTISDCNYSFSVTNLPSSTVNTITTVFEGQGAMLTQQQLNDQFPLQQGISTIPGAPAPALYFNGCERICIYTMTGCIDTCRMNQLDINQNLKAVDPVVTVNFLIPESYLPTWLDTPCTQTCHYRYTSPGSVPFTIHTHQLREADGTTVIASYTPTAADTQDSTYQKLGALAGISLYSDGTGVSAIIGEVAAKFVIRVNATNYDLNLQGTVSSPALCGCFLSLAGLTYPYTGHLLINATQSIELTAIANKPALLAAIQAVESDAIMDGGSNRIYFPAGSADCNLLGFLEIL